MPIKFNTITRIGFHKDIYFLAVLYLKYTFINNRMLYVILQPEATFHGISPEKRNRQNCARRPFFSFFGELVYKISHQKYFEGRNKTEI